MSSDGAVTGGDGASGSGTDEAATIQRARRDARETIRQSLITGAALAVPLVVTLIVVTFALNFFAGLLEPVVVVADALGLSEFGSAVFIQLATVLALVATVALVGFVAEHTVDRQIADRFHSVFETVPVVGAVYRSFRRMGDVLAESDTESFQEVKIVEYPAEGSYTVGFLTADTPPAIRESAGHETMWTLFVPMAPNPVMGGFVVYLPDERVHDVAMTVEEGIRAVVTSGVATSADGDTSAVPTERLRRLGLEGSTEHPGPAGASEDSPAEETPSERSTDAGSADEDTTAESVADEDTESEEASDPVKTTPGERG
ncbi:hypothetical protein BRC90_01545 [Halobacteriales archaeon QS_4_69_34]|nr:MAG: hypothetical protein BRC90_01545 [Halobacteriales archaeon QS_4_69_34]